MRFVIVTGMSGGGKSTAMKMLEDAGYYCADNMPVPLIEKFMELLAMPDNGIQKVALGLDVRADQSFEDVNMLIASLRETYTFEILFLEAADNVLLKRYKESRRVHPLSVDSDLMSGITRERALLASIKQAADYVIDTTNLLTRELKAELDKIFVFACPAIPATSFSPSQPGCNTKKDYIGRDGGRGNGESSMFNQAF